MTQRKLDTFFTVITEYNNNKNCFIYNPAERKAYFKSSPETETFITTASKVRLFYVKSDDDLYNPNNDGVPVINEKLITPSIIKSNLQKAIRRCQTDIAISTTLLLLKYDPQAFFRRLPIIFIEDVCLLTSFPVIVWFMMAGNEYKLTNTDVSIIVNIIEQLCSTEKYYDDDESDKSYNKVDLLNPVNLQCSEGYDCLLALFYRAQYGGMKGDINMLHNAINYYKVHPEEIVSIECRVSKLKPDYEFKIIPEAIDFHPIPYLLTYIKDKLYKNYVITITEDEVKSLIWFAHSAENYRKISVHMKSDEVKRSVIWGYIERELTKFRSKYII